MFQRYFLALLTALFLLAAAPHFAQAQTGSVGIGTTAPDASAALDITSTSKGLLPPRLTLAQRTALTNSATAPPVPGLVIYQTDNTPGLYAYDGAAWVRLGADNLGNHTATQALKLGTNALVGNGGSTGLSVTSTGDVRLPAANAYTYSAAKAYSITYGISDVQPEQEGAGAYKIRVTVGSAEYVYATAAMRIPVHLPQGATITGIKCYGQDTDASNDLRVYFISVLPTDTSMGAPGSYNDTAGSSGTPGYTVFSFTPSSSRIIDNNRTYYVLVNAPSDTCAIGAVRVTYTVTQTE